LERFTGNLGDATRNNSEGCRMSSSLELMKGTCFAVVVSRWRFLVKGLKKSPSLSRVSKRGESKFQEWVAVGLLEFRAMGMANASGKPATFAVVYRYHLAGTGPIFGYGDTWQLVINTGTTIVTFLMDFLFKIHRTGTLRRCNSSGTN
jgi:Low affinity iron permease